HQNIRTIGGSIMADLTKYLAEKPRKKKNREAISGSRKVEFSTPNEAPNKAATKSIKVTVETHKQLMILKAVTGLSITEIVAESVQQYGESHLNHTQRNLSQSLLEDPNQLSLDID
ncbi:hypothetical protein, partial [Pseudolactococcus yaeyamensis]